MAWCYPKITARNKNYWRVEDANDPLVWIDSHGYLQRLGCGPVHRAVALEKYGNLDGYDVHHIDGNRQNNEPGNLIAIKHAAHMALHKAMRAASKAIL